MPKKIAFTKITPLPSNIPRQLALDMLHSHSEIIELNPLVVEHHPIKAPQNAARDEYFAVWHEITQRIQWVPGFSSKISFKTVCHDMPWGLQTHAYAPMGVDLRNKWQICGNQPGEPREVRELGSNAPHDGLYLREDIDIICNLTVAPFVKKETNAATKVMVDRLVKKAELLDAGQLQAMFENGRLKTANPTLQNHFAAASHLPDPSQVNEQFAKLPLSPQTMPAGPRSPGMQPEGYAPDPDRKFMGNYHDIARANSQRYQNQGNLPPYEARQSFGSTSGNSPQPSAYARQSMQQYPNNAVEMSASMDPAQGLAIELPGSFYYAPQQQPQSQHLQPPNQQQNRFSTASELSGSSSPMRQGFPSPDMGASDRHSQAASDTPISSFSQPSRGMTSSGYRDDRPVSELAGSSG